MIISYKFQFAFKLHYILLSFIAQILIPMSNENGSISSEFKKDKKFLLNTVIASRFEITHCVFDFPLYLEIACVKAPRIVVRIGFDCLPAASVTLA